MLANRTLGTHILLLLDIVDRDQRLKLVKRACRVYVLLDLLDVEPSSLLVDMPFEQPSWLVVERRGCSRLGIPAGGQRWSRLRGNSGRR